MIARITTTEWGNTFWRFLHLISETYSGETKQKDAYSSLFLSLAQLIPCVNCKRDYEDYIQKEQNYTELMNALNHQDNSLLRSFVIKLHNSINSKLGKKVLGHAEAMDEHQNLIENGTCRAIPYSFIFTSLLILGFIFLFFKFK